MTELGVVVIGMGIAGQARVRDINRAAEYSPAFPFLQGVTLKGYVSRRSIDIDGIAALALDEVFTRDDIHLIIVCTENERHEELARRGLESGKHVLVEFPLALTAEKAKQLQQLAKEKGLHCHEEDIALLTETHQTMKTAAQGKTLESVDLTLEGRFNGWIENTSSSGPPFVTSITRLQTSIDMFGALSAKDAYIKQTDTSIETFALMHTAQDKPIRLHIQRKKDGVGRKTGHTIKFTDGTTLDSPPAKRPDPPQPPNNPGLFMKDFISFVEAVKSNKERAPSDDLTIQSLELADELYELAKANPQSTGLS